MDAISAVATDSRESEKGAALNLLEPDRQPAQRLRSRNRQVGGTC